MKIFNTTNFAIKLSTYRELVKFAFRLRTIVGLFLYISYKRTWRVRGAFSVFRIPDINLC
jgi:hypothetical protein